MGEIYEHTQVGAVMLVALAVAGAGLLWAGIQEGWPAGLAGALFAIAACLVLFTTLTVRIGDGVLAVRFGPGFPRRGGRSIRIGTDEPEELLRALAQAGVSPPPAPGGR
jgi:hypothetical protein